MYTQFFRLNHAPFSIAPDPHYLFLSERHREALGHLLYGVGSGGGFVLLTGEIGAGKTTVCRCFLGQIPADCNVAYIFNPKLTVAELLQTICDEFGVELPSAASQPPTVKDRVDAFNRFLLAAHADGRNNVLIIDEAQNLSPDVLEQLRLLTNLETDERKLLQIVLIGQPQLRDMLARPDLEQLAQRVIARYHLGSLSERESARYILHRLSVAGLTTASPFTQQALRRVHRLAAGVPRRINLLCDRALLGAYARGNQAIDGAIVSQAAKEVFGTRRTEAGSARWRHALLGVATGALLAGGAAWTIGRDAGYYSAAPKQTISGKPASAALIPTVAGDSEALTSPQLAGEASTQMAVVETGASSAQETNATGPSQESVDTEPGLPRDENQAWRALARLWGVTLPAGDACAAARTEQLYCYRGNQGVAEIRRLERPAILTLQDDTGSPYFALLTGLTNASATLHIGATRHTISLLELGRRFPGQFSTLWRAQPDQREVLVGGEHGADVAWLAQQMARLSGDETLADSQTFDRKLVTAVREFQRAQGLAPDGIVGPRTLMHLNSVAGVDEPRLQSSPPALTAGLGQ